MKVCINIHNQSGTGPFFKVKKLCEEISKNSVSTTLLCTSQVKKLFRTVSFENNIRIVEVPDLFIGKY